jgi:K+-transporting ATPase KdpC subunit
MCLFSFGSKGNLMLKQFKSAALLFGLLTLLTGLVYPLLITLVSQLIFPNQANGSLIIKNNQIVGSALIGQQFSDPKYFWGRLSATGDFPYNATSSGGTNFSSTNPALLQQVKDRLAALQAVDPDNHQPVPVDLVTASGSGLDPNISVAAAQYQAGRIARLRGIPPNQVQNLIIQSVEPRLFGFLGEPKVNVLKINLALDQLQ